MRRSGSVLLFAAVSLALHLGWVLWMPAGERFEPPKEQWVEVAFEAAPSPAEKVEAVAAAVTEAPARPETPSPETARTQRVVRKTSPSTPPATSATSAMEVAAPAIEVAAAAVAPEKPAKVLMLSPRAAALSVDAFVQASALRCAAPGATGNDVGLRDCAPNNGTAEAAQAALSRDLKAIAQNIPHLKTREAPNLRRRSDGSYAFDGHVFAALVRADGQVEFTDNAVKPQLLASLAPLKVVADVNDLVERNVLGRELYSAEKAWFLEQTRELRAQLMTEARRRELQQANLELERTLQQVLSDRGMSKSQKHDAVFLIWQDCGEDAQQKAHRRAVEAFVRRYLPQDSELGFAAEELEHLNNQRGALQRFEPYSDSKG